MLLADAVLERGFEAVLLAGQLRILVAKIECLERDVAPDQLGLKDVENGQHALGGIGLDQDVLAAPLDGGPNVLEVVSLGDLLLGLRQGVADLLLVDLAHDVERCVGHLGSFGCDVGCPQQGARGSCIDWRALVFRLVARPIGRRPWFSCYPSIRTKAGCPSGQWEWTVNPSRELRRFESFTCHHVRERASDLRKRGRRPLLIYLVGVSKTAPFWRSSGSGVASL